jgi:uncharacterized protein (TIGR04255 family)
VAGVVFDAPDAETTAILGSFWKERLSTDFPTLQQQPPYYPPIERLSPPKQSVDLARSFDSAFPSARLWAMSPDGNELLQLQPGWFACNWRRVKPDSEYDKWPQRRRAFSKWFNEFVLYMEEAANKDVLIRQCEVTYVNHIDISNEEHVHSRITDIFNGIGGLNAIQGLEQATFQASHLLTNEVTGQPYGRLHVKITPVFGSNGQTELYAFELTARGQSPGSYSDAGQGMLAFMDYGRAAIDHAFLALTSGKMHEQWGVRK